MNICIRKLLFLAGVLVMFSAIAPAAASRPQAESSLHDAIDRLVSTAGSGVSESRFIADMFPAAEVIVALDHRIRNDPAFAPGERARQFAFNALLRIGEFDDRGVRRYTDPRQVQLFIDALDPTSGATYPVLRSIHLADERFYGHIVPAIESLFEAESAPFSEAIHALGRIGSPAQSSLPILKSMLIDPQTVNPKIIRNQDEVEQFIEDSIPEAWREGYKEALENPESNKQWGLVTREESIIRFRSGAALARLRIDISLLASDIALYRTLDPLGQRAGARALVGVAMETGGAFDNTASTSVAAADYLAEHYGREDARGSRMEAIHAFAFALSSESTTQEARRAWQEALLRLIVDSDPEFRSAALSILQR